VNGPEGLRFTTLLEISVIVNFFLLIFDIAIFISSLAGFVTFLFSRILFGTGEGMIEPDKMHPTLF